MQNQYSDTLLPTNWQPSYQRSNNDVTTTGASFVESWLTPTAQVLGSSGSVYICFAGSSVSESLTTENIDSLISGVLSRYKVERKTSDMDWYTFLNNHHAESIDQENLTKIIVGIHTLMNEKNFSHLNSITTKIINEKSSPDSIICVLRASYTCRQEIKGWSKLLENAYSWLSGKGLDSAKLLRGLKA